MMMNIIGAQRERKRREGGGGGEKNMMLLTWPGSFGTWHSGCWMFFLFEVRQ